MMPFQENPLPIIHFVEISSYLFAIMKMNIHYHSKVHNNVAIDLKR